jgi:hypothetical protein
MKLDDGVLGVIKDTWFSLYSREVRKRSATVSRFPRRDPISMALVREDRDKSDQTAPHVGEKASSARQRDVRAREVMRLTGGDHSPTT